MFEESSAGRWTGAIEMLRITIAEMATEQRWTLEGRLVGPWVGELRTCWKKSHRAQNGRACTVDLSGVTFIDIGGQRLLRTMSKEGTQFIATGAYTKHVLDQLKPNGKRRLLKVISCLFGALLGGGIAPLFCLKGTPERPKDECSRRLERRTQFNQSATGNRSRPSCPGGPDPETSYSQRERLRMLFLALNELPPGTRKAIEQHGR
jgi:hypothetical protein